MKSQVTLPTPPTETPLYALVQEVIGRVGVLEARVKGEENEVSKGSRGNKGSKGSR